MSTTTSSSPAPNVLTFTPSLVSTTFTSESLVIALSASERTVEIFEGVTNFGGSVVTHHLKIPYTGTTAFPSASIPGLEVYTSVETSWKYINLSTITTPQAGPSSTESPIIYKATSSSTTAQPPPSSAAVTSQTASEAARASSTPTQVSPVSAGLSPNAKLASAPASL